jgi:replicative DNA helicase
VNQMSSASDLPPQEDYNTPAPDNDWSLYPQVIKALEEQRNRLARAERMYQAGEASDLDPRQLLRTAQERIRRALPELAQLAGDGTPVDVTVRDLIADYWNQVKQRKDTATTGFKTLNDALSGGLEAKRLVGVLGMPNCGKTTFVHQVADHIAEAGRPVLYVTSEDSPSVLLAKTLARIGQVNYNAVLKGWPTEEQKINRALAAQLDRKSSDRLRYLDASNGASLDAIRDKAAAHFAQYQDAERGGPGVLVVDYLQRLARSLKARTGQSADLREVVTNLTEWLRALACDLDCCVIVVSAQNRANYGRSGGASAMASAKESGDIEYTCDVMLSLVEDDDKHRVAPAGMTAILLNVEKNRQGKRGVGIPLDFWPDRQQFTEVER